MDVTVTVADPRDQQVRAVLDRHLAFAREVTPPGHVHALPADRIDDPSVTLYGAWLGTRLLGIAALRRLDDEHVEIKSMHVSAESRGLGVGRTLLRHLLEVAGQQGYRRVSLETGTLRAFAAARRLYEEAGFRPCPPFGEYTVNPYSICMTRPV